MASPLLDSERRCPKCNELFYQALILTCGHVICRKCLRHCIEQRGPNASISCCSQCDASEPILPEQASTEHILDSFVIDRAAENLALEEIALLKSTCSFCPTTPSPGTPAGSVCLDCNKRCCEKCSDDHRQHNDRHTLRPLSTDYSQQSEPETLSVVNPSEASSSCVQDQNDIDPSSPAIANKARETLDNAFGQLEVKRNHLAKVQDEVTKIQQQAAEREKMCAEYQRQKPYFVEELRRLGGEDGAAAADPRGAGQAIVKRIEMIKQQATVPCTFTTCDGRMIEEEHAPREIRVIVIGKPGSGKSAFANLLLEDIDVFNVHKGMVKPAACDSTSKWHRKKLIGNTVIEITDTPAFDAKDTGSEEVFPSAKELLKCAVLTYPGPDIVCLMIRCDQIPRVDYSKLSGLPAELKKRLVVVFSGLDGYTYLEMDSSHSEKKIAALRRELRRDLETRDDPKLSDVRAILSDTNNRYLAVDNRGCRKETFCFRKEAIALFTNLMKLNAYQPFNCDDGLCTGVRAAIGQAIARFRDDPQYGDEQQAEETVKRLVSEKKPKGQEILSELGQEMTTLGSASTLESLCVIS